RPACSAASCACPWTARRKQSDRPGAEAACRTVSRRVPTMPADLVVRHPPEAEPTPEPAPNLGDVLAGLRDTLERLSRRLGDPPLPNLGADPDRWISLSDVSALTSIGLSTRPGLPGPASLRGDHGSGGEGQVTQKGRGPRPAGTGAAERTDLKYH